MIGKICEVVDAHQDPQLKIGHPSATSLGSFVLVTRDCGGGFFCILSEHGQALICSEYLSVCSAITGSVS